MTETDLVAHALGFFFAGFETSSSTMTFALYELSKQPKLQQTARCHIEEVLQRHGGQVTYDALQEMNYLDWIFQGAVYPSLSSLQKRIFSVGNYISIYFSCLMQAYVFKKIKMLFKFIIFLFTETLRKYPLLSILRECTKNYTIPGTQIVIEKGTPIIIPTFGLHNDPKYYPDPEQFIPERFSDEEMVKKYQYIYLPFGEGPRLCIGNLHNKYLWQL
jgi:cytochrome P450 family 6